MREPHEGSIAAPHMSGHFFVPASSQDTLDRLGAGNRRAAQMSGPKGVPTTSDYPLDEFGLPLQMPLATMIGCSDARVPPEILFGVGYNDLFLVRAAGNVLGREGVGSLLYAANAFAPPNQVNGRSMRAMVVVGHLGCGAVKATIETYQKGIAPETATGGPLDSILEKIAGPPLKSAVRAFENMHGTGSAYRRENLPTLLELVVYLNAAQVGREARQWLDREAPAAAPHIAVVYGVVDPLHRHLHSRPGRPGEADPEPFAAPPRDDRELHELADELLSVFPIP